MFDRYVVEQTKPSWKRRALMIASIGLHGLAAIALVVWSFFHVEEIAPPALSLTFFSAPPPPPPPPPPAAKHKSDVKKTQPVDHKMVQPDPTKTLIQPKDDKPVEKDEPEEDGAQEGGEEGGEEGGVKGGVIGGVKGGVVGGVVGSNGTDMKAKAPPPKTVAGFTLIAQQISHPDPHLPEWVKNQHHEPIVKGMYKVCIRNDGHISDVTPMTSINGADQTIGDQIRTSWVYKPQPVPVCFIAALTFKLQ